MKIGDKVTDHNGQPGTITKLGNWGIGYIVRLACGTKVVRYGRELAVRR